MAHPHTTFRRGDITSTTDTPIIPPEEPAGGQGTDQVRDVLEMVCRYLRQCRYGKVTGKLTIEIDLKYGGVIAKWASVRSKEQ
jgi:hypothetical protein